MTNEIRAKYEAAWKKHEAEAEEAKTHAQAAKENHRYSDYIFWTQQYENAKKEAEEMFIKFMA